MQLNQPKYRLLLFLGIWFLLNLLQASLTELNTDEPYYWSYSKELAWGYYDHPPAAALFIKIGASILPGGVGVRLMTVVLSTLTLVILWLLLDRPRKPEAIDTLFLLFIAMPFMQVYAFVATADGPLLFFTALFFLFYKYFLEKESAWWVTLAWGATMAAMLYSKYHGVLIIGFTVLSNLRLLLNPRFYVAALFGALLFTPHLYWQFDHDFPSFRYHLLQRNNPFQFKYLYTYLLNQLVIFNPFIFPFLIIALIQQTKKNIAPQQLLKRAFLFLIYGFWLFFLITVFRGHVEPHWLAASCIGFIGLTYYHSLEHEQFRRRLTRFILISLIPLGLFRIAIIDGLLGEYTPLFHDRNWVYPLADEVGEAPVLFLRYFREPSTYNFYTGKEAYNITDIYATRQSQYNLWDWEKALQGRRIAILGGRDWDCSNCRDIDLDTHRNRIKWVDDFQVSQKVRFNILESANTWKVAGAQEVKVEITNPYDHDIILGTGDMPLHPVAFFRVESGSFNVVPLQFNPPLDLIPARQSVMQDFHFIVPGEVGGNVLFGMGIKTGDLPPVWQSDFLEIQISTSEK